MKIYDEINKAPSALDRLKFGLTVLLGFSAIALHQYFVLHHAGAARAIAITAATVFALSFIAPIGRALYIGWMGLGITIGLFTQPIVMGIAYFVLFVPLGILFRAIGRDVMKRNRDRTLPSYWEDYRENDDPASYFRQY